MTETYTKVTKLPTIDDFQFVKAISRGAFGKVFIGHKKGHPEKIYAIKVVKKIDMVNKNLTNQVVAERDAMAKVVSPFVVQLYYSIQSQQNIFLVMEYMIGGDVKSLLMVAGYFDEHMALMYTAEVTLALQYLHRKGIVHRDLKPDNMLITAKGHIKLTDFGLAKLNMNFSDSSDIPMTPKTPMHSSQPQVNDYRTPGQILSLRSTFAFSSSKCSSYNSSMTTPASKSRTPTHYPSDISQPTPVKTDERNLGLSHSKLNKQKSMRDVLLSHSTSKYVNQSAVMRTPGKQTSRGSTPPIKRLMSSLQKSSLLWKSTPNYDDALNTAENRTCDNSKESEGTAITKPSLDNGNGVSCKREISSVLQSTISTIDISDDVFMSGSSCNISGEFNSSESTGNKLQGTDTDVTGQKSCVCDNKNLEDCVECGSHQKASSRQEKLTDDTPQMHRTEESVWNSYAAKHLRSLRRDSYSEDSEDNEKENVPLSLPNTRAEKLHSPLIHSRVRTKFNPRRLTKTKSFCYPSDEESDSEGGRYNNRFRFARKRSFADVEQSPVRRTHSADSGLTREIALLRFGACEPQSKRSHSIPRTRIRFHSGKDREKADKTPQSPLISKLDTKNCLESMIKETRSLSDSDKIEVLTEDEKRLIEGHSDTSMSESDHISESDKQNSKVLMKPKLVTCKDDLSKDCDIDHRKDSLDYDEPMVTGSRNICRLVNKNLSHLQPRMVSSLNSESEVGDNLATNLSSIFERDTSTENSAESSIFTSMVEAPSSSAVNKCKTSPENKLISSEPLLPPPPPKARRHSGKKTPAKLRFASVATCISPYVHNESRSRNSSGWNDVSMTPDTSHRYKGYNTPNARCPQTPKTPLQRALARSYSFSNPAKTPFRTPKSVKRVSVQEPEEERILGTPDYLAPEILMQKPHGPAVDWWSLGVCLFEFLTGVPPFNDQTPEKVFENILNKDIPWPDGEEALSENSRKTIESLLTMDPSQRANAKDLKKMAAFCDIDWDNVLKMQAPWTPQPDDMMDTSYFEARNMMQDLFVSDVDF